MTRTYKIVKDGQGSSGFLCPPGHPNHYYVLNEFNGPRGRAVQGISSIQYALRDEADASPLIKTQAERIINQARLICSEAWVRNVYGYFRNMYAHESGSRNASKAVSDKTNSLPPERHLAVLCIREYFPEHKPRVDLINDPGKGYGSWPCIKCGERVQYEARADAYAIVKTRVSGSGRTQWSYLTECAEGGAHEIGG